MHRTYLGEALLLHHNARQEGFGSEAILSNDAEVPINTQTTQLVHITHKIPTINYSSKHPRRRTRDSKLHNVNSFNVVSIHPLNP